MSFLSKNNLKIFRRDYLKFGGEDSPEVWTLLDFSSGAFARAWENLYRSGGIL